MPPRLPQSVPTPKFVCRADDFGMAAGPKPVKSVMPDWFRKLPRVDKLLLLLLSLSLFLLKLLLLWDLLFGLGLELGGMSPATAMCPPLRLPPTC